MILPIRPDDIIKYKDFPNGVIEAFNKMIVKKWDGRQSTFTLGEVEKLAVAYTGLTPNELYDAHLMDVEPLYRLYGWKVTFDKSGFNEPYPDRFIFEKSPEVHSH